MVMVAVMAVDSVPRVAARVAEKAAPLAVAETVQVVVVLGEVVMAAAAVADRPHKPADERHRPMRKDCLETGSAAWTCKVYTHRPMVQRCLLGPS